MSQQRDDRYEEERTIQKEVQSMEDAAGQTGESQTTEDPDDDEDTDSEREPTHTTDMHFSFDDDDSVCTVSLRTTKEHIVLSTSTGHQTRSLTSDTVIGNQTGQNIRQAH
jgi:hypothetical protein